MSSSFTLSHLKPTIKKIFPDYFINKARVLRTEIRKKNIKAIFILNPIDREIENLFLIKDYSSVIGKLSGLDSDLLSLKSNVTLARSYSKIGDFNSSVTQYENLVQNFGCQKNYKILYEYGLALLRARNFSKSVSIFEEIFEGTTETSYEPSPFIISLFKTGQHKRALRLLSVQRVKFPFDLKFIALEVDFNKSLGKPNYWGSLLTQLEKIIFPKNTNFDQILKLVNWLVKQSQFKTALKLLKRFPSHYKNQIDYQYLLALVLFYDGSHKDSLKITEKLLKKDINNTKILTLKSNLLSALGKNTLAIETLQHLMSQSDSNKFLERIVGVHRVLLENFNNEEKEIIAEATLLTDPSKITLSEEQARILRAIKKDGFAKTDFDSLFNDNKKELWKNADDFVHNFIGEEKVQELIHKISSSHSFDDDPYFNGIQTPPYVSRSKPSVISYEAFHGNLKISDPISKLYYQKEILEIVASYYGMASKLRNLTLWLNPPISSENQKNAKGSQLWHRDQEDKYILKCFIYFSDIDETSGALEYLASSTITSEGEHSKIWPYPCTSGYPGGSFVQDRVTKKSHRRASGVKGSIIFVDTNGFHKGGLVKTDMRALSAGTYLRPIAAAVSNGQTKKSALDLPEQNSLNDLEKFAVD